MYGVTQEAHFRDPGVVLYETYVYFVYLINDDTL